MHTTDAKGAVTRLVDLFPSDRHDDIRTQLSMSLRSVVAQHLLPSGNGGRRVLALEVLFANFAARAAIRQGKIETLDSVIQSGRKDGMMSLDLNLRSLCEQGRINLDTARAFAKDPSEFGGV
jgi:twitching motility protein PilT